MEYNIEHGFHSSGHVLDPTRVAAAQRVVAQEHPDILVLIEACYGQANDYCKPMNYSEIFDFPHSFHVSYSFRGKLPIGGHSVLSNREFKGEEIFLSNKKGIRASIPLDGRVLTLDAVHPSPSISDDKKLESIQPLLRSKKVPYIITGDFNALSPDDSYDEGLLAEELKVFPVDVSVSDWLKCKVVRGIFDSGLKDALHPSKRTSTVPTYIEGRRKIGTRIDYMFITPEIKVIDSYVIKTADTNIASDHFPLVGIFEF